MKLLSLLGILLLSSFLPGQDQGNSPSDDEGAKAYAKKVNEAGESTVRELANTINLIQMQRFRLDLGLPMDREFLDSLIPPKLNGTKTEYAKELDLLAHYQEKLKDLQLARAKVEAAETKAMKVPGQAPGLTAAVAQVQPSPLNAGGKTKPIAAQKEKAIKFAVPVDRSGMAQYYYSAGEKKEQAVVEMEQKSLEAAQKPGARELTEKLFAPKIDKLRKEARQEYVLAMAVYREISTKPGASMVDCFRFAQCQARIGFLDIARKEPVKGAKLVAQAAAYLGTCCADLDKLMAAEVRGSRLGKTYPKMQEQRVAQMKEMFSSFRDFLEGRVELMGKIEALRGDIKKIKDKYLED